MSRDRIAYAVLMAIVTGVTAAAGTGALDVHHALWATAAIAGINGLLRVLWPDGPNAAPNAPISSTSEPKS